MLVTGSKICLQHLHLLEKSIDLLLNLGLQFQEGRFVSSAELIGLHCVHEFLAILEASTHVVGKPCSNGGSSSGDWVLGVVNNILLHHGPMEVSESEGLVDSLEQEEGGSAVTHSILLEAKFLLSLETVVDVVLMRERSVVSQLEKILR